uniref:Uncharacterized protein n=1 Tax=Arundo donax TaxID=35708 RepID=A0A0A9ANF4_ARUDO
MACLTSIEVLACMSCRICLFCSCTRVLLSSFRKELYMQSTSSDSEVYKIK